MDELSELTGLRARVTTISACQTAIVDINNLPDEGLSIATVMIAAGSACAIASLWPVDDGATALLMIHLYEQMITKSVPPPEALRRAQRWLQKLTLAERAEFLSGHRELATELARRPSGHDRASRPDESPPPGYASHSPYKHPYYWAGFVAVGA
jgi:CHAT domain-containing protein